MSKVYKSRARKINGDINKQLEVEKLLNANDMLSNQEVADIITADFHIKCTSAYVRTCRARVKKRYYKMFGHQITSEDVQRSIQKTVIAVADTLRENLGENRVEVKIQADLFQSILDGAKA